MNSIVDNTQRARTVILLFWLLLAAGLIMLVSQMAYITLDQGTDTTEGMLNTVQYLGIILLNFGLGIAVIVTFIQWFRRSYHNLSRAGYTTQYEEQYAAWYWFYPILSLFKPYQIMKEIWYTTQQAYADRVERHTLVRIWWMLFVLRSVVNIVVSKIELSDVEVLLCMSVFEVITCYVTIVLIQKVVHFEQLFSQFLHMQQIGQPVPQPTDTEEEFY